MPSRIRIVIGLACCLVASARDASACFCDLNPPCVAFWWADAVFVGRVTAHEDWRQSEGQMPETVTTLTVLRTFRGEQRSSIVLRGMRTSCSYDFRIGDTYLVYASRSSDDRLSTGRCSGTKPLAEAAIDIATIPMLPSLPPLGWIYGTVHRAVRDPVTRAWGDALAAGVPVTIASPGTRTTVLTDHAGRFEFPKLTPGTYSVQMTVPATEYAPGREVVVTPRACSPLYLQINPSPQLFPHVGASTMSLPFLSNSGLVIR
jgi:hypothetical protein